MITRAWSQFTLKSADDEQRVITGIASTPSTDRAGDIVEPLGAEFDLPLPFLWQHDSGQPVGHVVAAKPNKSGIPVTIQMAKIDEPGTLRDRLNEAWQSLKIGLVKGLSIGFAPIEHSYIDGGGIHFTKWSWLELSAVTIPANQEASITSIKRADSSPERKFAPVAGVDEVLELIDTKVTGPRMIEGLASSGTVNVLNYSMDPKGAVIRLPVPLLVSHGRIDGKDLTDVEAGKVGDVTWAMKTPRGIFVRAVLNDSLAADKAWELVQSGKLKALSGAGRDHKLAGVVEGISYYGNWTLKEVSMCPSGANPDCFFRVMGATTKAVRPTTPFKKQVRVELICSPTGRNFWFRKVHYSDGTSSVTLLEPG